MVIVESGDLKYIEILKSATPILTVIATIVLAIWTIKANSRNLIVQMKANSRNLIVQMNQSEIMKNIKELSKITRTGNKDNLKFFIDSADGIYIPKKLRNEIEEILKNEPTNRISEEHIKEILIHISEYIFKMGI